MKTITNVLALSLISCLLTGQVHAAETLKTPETPEFQLGAFALPTNMQNTKPGLGLTDVFNKLRNGDLNNRALGGMDGGGGKILLCPSADGSIKARVLDVYEGEAAGLQMDLGPGETLQEKIQFVLNRLKKAAPNRAHSYAKWIADLLGGEAAFYENAILPVTADMGVTILPVNCEVAQVVVQRNEQEATIPGLARYLFDKNVFFNLDVDSQAALIFHEVIYREALMNGAKSSVTSRYLNYLILSKKMETITQEQFNSITKKIGSDCQEVSGAQGLSGCKHFPTNYIQQTFEFGGLQFSGIFSVSKGMYVRDEPHLIRYKQDHLDFTPILNQINKKNNIQLEFLRIDKDIIFYFDRNYGTKQSYITEVLAKDPRTQLLGRCELHFSKQKNSYLLCKIEDLKISVDGVEKVLDANRYDKNGGYSRNTVKIPINNGMLEVSSSLFYKRRPWYKF